MYEQTKLFWKCQDRRFQENCSSHIKKKYLFVLRRQQIVHDMKHCVTAWAAEKWERFEKFVDYAERWRNVRSSEILYGKTKDLGQPLFACEKSSGTTHKASNSLVNATKNIKDKFNTSIKISSRVRFSYEENTVCACRAETGTSAEGECFDDGCTRFRRKKAASLNPSCFSLSKKNTVEHSILLNLLASTSRRKSRLARAFATTFIALLFGFPSYLSTPEVRLWPQQQKWQDGYSDWWRFLLLRRSCCHENLKNFSSASSLSTNQLEHHSHIQNQADLKKKHDNFIELTRFVNFSLWPFPALLEVSGKPILHEAQQKHASSIATGTRSKRKHISSKHTAATNRGQSEQKRKRSDSYEHAATQTSEFNLKTESSFSGRAADAAVSGKGRISDFRLPKGESAVGETSRKDGHASVRGIGEGYRPISYSKEKYSAAGNSLFDSGAATAAADTAGASKTASTENTLDQKLEASLKEETEDRLYQERLRLGLEEAPPLAILARHIALQPPVPSSATQASPHQTSARCMSTCQSASLQLQHGEERSSCALQVPPIESVRPFFGFSESCMNSTSNKIKQKAAFPPKSPPTAAIQRRSGEKTSIVDAGGGWRPPEVHIPVRRERSYTSGSAHFESGSKRFPGDFRTFSLAAGKDLEHSFAFLSAPLEAISDGAAQNSPEQSKSILKNIHGEANEAVKHFEPHLLHSNRETGRLQEKNTHLDEYSVPPATPHGHIIYRSTHFSTSIKRQPQREADLQRKQQRHAATVAAGQTGASLLEARATSPAGRRAKGLFSALQKYLDKECDNQSDGLEERTIYARLSRTDAVLFCYTESELDFSRYGTLCVDSCGERIACQGILPSRTASSVVEQRKLEVQYDSPSRKITFCVTSRLQARLDEICGTPEYLWRQLGDASYCVESKLVTWTEEADQCVTDCGTLTSCKGILSLQGSGEVLVTEDQRKRAEEQQKLTCPCNETFAKNTMYEGCQSKTRTGRTCQRWDSNDPHVHHELTAENHNYCRNPMGEAEIWCYTTDPEVRFDYCDPLGLEKQYVQPNEEVDLIMAGLDLNADVVIRVFDSSFSRQAKCRDVGAGAGMSRFVQFMQVDEESVPVPEFTIQDGRVSVLTWEKVKILAEAEGNLLFCLCNFEYIKVEPTSRNSLPCSANAAYNVDLGQLSITGPLYPQEEQVTLNASEKQALRVTGLNLNMQDSLLVIAGQTAANCMTPNLFALRLNLFSSKRAEDLRAVRTELDRGDDMFLRTGFYSVSSTGKTATTESFSIPIPGHFALCWQSMKGGYRALGLAKRLIVQGVATNQTFRAIYAPSVEGISQKLSTLFLHSFRYKEPILDDAVSVRVVATPPCTGAILGRSHQVKLLETQSAAVDPEERTYKALRLNLQEVKDASGEYLKHLDVCLQRQSKAENYLHLGFAIVSDFYAYSLSDFVIPSSMHPEAPDGQFTMTIDSYCILGMHWGPFNPSNSVFLTEMMDFFTKGVFPKVMTFWLNKEDNLITVWSLDLTDLSPSLLATCKVLKPISLAVDASYTNVYMYLLRGEPTVLEMYDITTFGDLTSATPVSVVTETGGIFVNLCCLTLLYADEAAGSRPLVLTLDVGTGYLHIFSDTLVLLNSTNQPDKMPLPMTRPKSLYCSRTPQSAYAVTLAMWDCFIAEQGPPRIIYLRVDAEKGDVTFITEYSGEGVRDGVDTSLRAPHSVVAHYYSGKVLVYAAEEKSPYPILLTKGDDEDMLHFYAFLSQTNEGFSSINHLSLYYFSSETDSLENVWLASLRDDWKGPQLQIVSLDSTATVANFQYYPHKWYAVGDTHTLEPSVIGLGSLKGVSKFVLGKDVANAAYISSIASVDAHTGVVKLTILSIQRVEVEIQVYAVGVVNQLRSSFKIKIACKDGYFSSMGMCAKCPAGTYNSLALTKANPKERWGKCQECTKFHTTVAEGSINADQCQCQKGYHKDESVKGADCEPCPAGTWKSIVANTGCLGHSCPAHSHTDVTGATTPEERRCECFPGYYLVGDNVQTQECIPTQQGYYSPGGFKAQSIPCPLHTSTNPTNDPNFLAESLEACVCRQGFTAADPEKLKDSASPEAQLRSWLRSNPDYADLKDSQVCVRCGRRMYKDTLGSQSCTPCPEHSFSSLEGAVSKKRCDMCDPGYYQTSNADMPCAECPKDHFCVGSETHNPVLLPDAGKKTLCPAYTETVPPNYQNDHPFKCMCQMGYVLDYVEAATSLVVCAPARVGAYKDIVSNIHGLKCPSKSSTKSVASVSLEDCICTVGHYLDETSFMCEPCPIGYYCPGGRTAEKGKHKPAVPCPPSTNTTSMRSASLADCVCDRGFYRFGSQINPGEAFVCRACPANSYKDWVGNDVCKTCSENSGTEETGATSAAQCLCSRGYYYDVKLAECTACSDPLRYCPGGQVDCQPSDPDCVNGKKPSQPQPCPVHTRITAGYDTPWSLDDCKCDRGFAYKGGGADVGAKSCEACSPGSYKSSVQDSNCNGLCGTHSTSFPGAESQSQCFCEEGTYFAADACHSCPVGAICRGGIHEDAEIKLRENPSSAVLAASDHIKPFAEAGYYLNKLKPELESPSDWQFTHCPIRNACLLHGVCSETMTEYLCSECKEGYTNTFNKGEICTACPSAAGNISFIFGYYLGVLLFNIVMTYMNVAAGFNRRSIHSIVIKIATNYMTCISVLSVVDLNNIGFPSWVTHITTSVAEQVMVKERSRWMSVDCLLRDGFSLSFSDSFFYTMLFFALLPIALPIVVTVMMFIIVQRVHVWYRKSTQKKLNLLKQTMQYGLYTLSEQLREKYEEDRLFMIFRYIPLPGESPFRRFVKFMEDMIPIYVTVLFFVYTSTTRYMLSLLDCSYIDFGQGHKAKYFLRAAMSVECEVSLQSPYLKFFILGIVGLCVWSIGIPLASFLVLYKHRRNLNSRETRLKYGFLHNGFVKKYWYWEMVVFARKFMVLVVSSVVIIPTENMSGSRIWMAVLIAVVFLLFHLVTQPFDKRSYLTLDRLENHSMGIWTITLIVMAMMIGSGFGDNVNLALSLFLAVLTVLFVLEVAFSLVFAYFDNVRAQKTFFTVPVIRYLFRFFASLSEKRRAREPIVVYDVENEVIQLVAVKRQAWNFFRARKQNINLAERNYFIKVMAETLGFAVVHMKLDVVPGSFLEFALRLGMTFHRMEEDSQQNKKSLQAIAEGDLLHLADWSKQEQEKKERTQLLKKASERMSKRLGSFYKDLEFKIARRNPKPKDPEEVEERIQDCDGEAANDEVAKEISDESTESETEEGETEKDESARLTDLKENIEDMTEEEQLETMYLFDSSMMNCGIALSDFYLALLKLQLKDSQTISQQFDAFKAQKKALADDYAVQLLQKNRKLKIIREALQTLLVSSGTELARLGLSEEAFKEKQKELEDLTSKVNELTATLEELRSAPQKFGDTVEEEWFDEDEEEVLQKVREEELAAKQKEDAEHAAAEETLIQAQSEEDAASEGARSDFAQGELTKRSIQIIGFDSDTWEE